MVDVNDDASTQDASSDISEHLSDHVPSPPLQTPARDHRVICSPVAANSVAKGSDSLLGDEVLSCGERTRGNTLRGSTVSRTSPLRGSPARLLLLERAVRFGRDVFARMDKTSDGKLTRTEVRRFFRNNPQEKAHIMGSCTWKSFFARMDVNEDGALDEEAFLSAVTPIYHDVVEVKGPDSWRPEEEIVAARSK